MLYLFFFLGSNKELKKYSSKTIQIFMSFSLNSSNWKITIKEHHSDVWHYGIFKTKILAQQVYLQLHYKTALWQCAVNEFLMTLNKKRLTTILNALCLRKHNQCNDD